MSGWFAVKIIAAADASDAAEHALNELDSLGTEIDQLRKKPGDDVTVVGYFTSPPEESTVNKKLDNVLEAFDLDRSTIRSVEFAEIADQDWLAEWKKHWRPTRVGRFLVAPSWENVEPSADTILIRIEPNMAFGTGTHETTKLCLKAIDENFTAGMSFLDVGTGTGILAIAAAKLGASAIAAYDVDADSIKIARENAEQNGVADKISFVDDGIDQSTDTYDFVCANVTLDVISPMLELLRKKSRKTLVLSGILAEQETQITTQLERLGFSAPHIEHDGEWISVLIELT